MKSKKKWLTKKNQSTTKKITEETFKRTRKEVQTEKHPLDKGQRQKILSKHDLFLWFFLSDEKTNLTAHSQKKHQ